MVVYHVSTTGSDASPGSASAPFRTIGRAAEVAYGGDVVRVHEGEYREWVMPPRGGRDDMDRIVYEAADGEHVVIKGSEVLTGWRRDHGAVWTAAVPNTWFHGWNPFAKCVAGDWLVRPAPGEPQVHLGQVYLNGAALREAPDVGALDTTIAVTTVVDDRTGQTCTVQDPQRMTMVWYAAVGPDETVIRANFGPWDPNRETVEITVRRSVFYPALHHVDFVTVRGFELAQAATPWAPPTGDQPGLIGPNWAKGWIIEDNVIHHARCSAVSLGKEASTGDNEFTHRHDKPGYQYQLEAVFSGRRIGWTKEMIGSHVVRRNRIFACGQNGIVGHMGCAFSRIEDNDISGIAVDREFYGHEIGGVKLHAAIDVEIIHNRIHDCALGIWCDWEAQGTRISRNVMYANNRDLYVEVSHGPYVVDHNILGSAVSVESMSDGGAYVANLICGTFLVEPVLDRATPYHLAHSTEIAGYAVVYGGDDRLIANIFVGHGGSATNIHDAYPNGVAVGATAGYGTSVYDGHPASMAEYIGVVVAGLPGDLDLFQRLKNPVYIRGNHYLSGAEPYRGEVAPIVHAGASTAALIETASAVELTLSLPTGFSDLTAPVVRGEDLPHPRMVEALFESTSGQPARFDTDLLGQHPKTDAAVAGPIFALHDGENRVTVWGTGS